MSTINSKLLVLLKPQHPLPNKTKLHKFKSWRRKRQRYTHYIKPCHSSSQCPRKEREELRRKASHFAFLLSEEKQSTLWLNKQINRGRFQELVCLTARIVQDLGDVKVASADPLQQEGRFFASWGRKHIFSSYSI